ncbi:hypothetical protein LOC68_10610 [Blastopirellula sp. JC732]|uniref:Uncharacterized protein n=1 Tax=Blastopirellula sediminis TaxID=2894196 RepID=A0A9X1MM92_9BACT|nr:hypothetical protein [Blastopirellula sediminis]MCC9608373.1 hypothetical protein [Blastopirellula sediminis]MCC9628850.1 hypothetical protein [Blastopirellula sediminis]
MNWNLSTITFGLIALAAVGCSSESVKTSAPTASGPSPAGVPYILAAEPTGALGVAEARERAEDESEVIVVGRIGGSENPWIENRAAFSLVDNALKACSDIPGDACESPWDYCCETDKLPSSMALVKVVDANGEVVKEDARKLLGVKELSTVVVQGKADRDADGNLTILATNIFVK